MEKFDLKWKYTNKMVNDLMKINSAKAIVDILEIPISIEEEIKKESIAKIVHYSTKIEGNNLKLDEVKDAIKSKKETHERNVLEVRNYYNALIYLNQQAEKRKPIDEELILQVHNLIIGKKITSNNEFRNGQNIVEDSISGNIVYMPPEAKDIKPLINQMIKEFSSKENEKIPLPIRAGILAYEFVTIHPFWDGNGRCSRLLATYVLKAFGYDLKGFYVMEEFYDKNIEEYYNSLQMNLHHNFYFGRNSADITKWLEYFISVMANTFETVSNRIKEIYNKKEIEPINLLDKRERWIANYIKNHGYIKAKIIAEHFKINLDTANNWIKKWIQEEFLMRKDTNQKRNVDYKLTEKYEFGLMEQELKYL